MQWAEIKSELKENMPGLDYDLWVEPLNCRSVNGSGLELAVPDRYFLAFFAVKYLPLVENVSGESVRLVIADNNSSAAAPDPVKPSGPGQLRLPAMPNAKSCVRSLHPRFTFDRLVEGASNNVASSACRAIAGGKDTLGTSLYIRSTAGLGKSHLTHAVAHHIMKHSPGSRLHYLTAGQFSGEMVRAIKANAMDGFKDKYHKHCDILLLEDVQALTGKPKTQQELNELLDVLINSGKRVILTGAQAPRDLPNIDTAIRSRMSAGLLATIERPGLETRQRIIHSKAASSNLPLGDDLVEYLARLIKGDIRLIESAIVGLKARALLSKALPDLDMVREVVGNVVDCPVLCAESIRGFVADQFGVSVPDLQSKTRAKKISFPRQVSMWLARKYTDQGLAEIGEAFNRYHSTVLHSIKTITQAMARNSSVNGQVAMLAEKLEMQAV